MNLKKAFQAGLAALTISCGNKKIDRFDVRNVSSDFCRATDGVVNSDLSSIIRELYERRGNIENPLVPSQEELEYISLFSNIVALNLYGTNTHCNNTFVSFLDAQTFHDDVISNLDADGVTIYDSPPGFVYVDNPAVIGEEYTPEQARRWREVDVFIKFQEDVANLFSMIHHEVNGHRRCLELQKNRPIPESERTCLLERDGELGWIIGNITQFETLYANVDRTLALFMTARELLRYELLGLDDSTTIFSNYRAAAHIAILLTLNQLPVGEQFLTDLENEVLDLQHNSFNAQEFIQTAYEFLPKRDSRLEYNQKIAFLYFSSARHFGQYIELRLGRGPREEFESALQTRLCLELESKGLLELLPECNKGGAL